MSAENSPMAVPRVLLKAICARILMYGTVTIPSCIDPGESRFIQSFCVLPFYSSVTERIV